MPIQAKFWSTGTPTRQLLLAPYPPVKFLPVPPQEDLLLSPEDLNARAVAITKLLWDTLSQVDSYTHGGLNE
jgi:hypothetical protein